MKRPRFTDSYRFPHGGYTPAVATNVPATFRRARRQIEAEAQHQAEQEAAVAAETRRKVRRTKEAA